MSKSKTCVIFINQIREKIGVMFGNPETTTGGRALKFYASVRLDIRRIGSDQGRRGGRRQPDQGQGGQEQGRAAVPGGGVRHPVRRGHLAGEGDLLDLGVEHRLVSKSGTWLSYGDTRLGQGRENARAFLKEHPELATELEEKLREILPTLARPASAAEES